MGAYETKFVYPMDGEIPTGALSQALENQRRVLLDAMLGEIKPNKKYIVELRQESYEDPPNYLAGYKAAIFVDEYNK